MQSGAIAFIPVVLLLVLSVIIGSFLPRPQNSVKLNPETTPSSTNFPASIEASTNLPQTGTEVAEKRINADLSYFRFYRKPDGSRMPATNWVIIGDVLSDLEQRQNREILSVLPEPGTIDDVVTTVGLYIVHKPKLQFPPTKEQVWKPTPNPSEEK